MKSYPPESGISGLETHSAAPRRIVHHDLPCPECGYNLRGIREGRCPECARPFTIRSAIHDSRGAADLGFWQIYQAALLRPRRFWRESGRWLTKRSAVVFALGCSLLASAATAFFLAALIAIEEDWNLLAAIALWGICFAIAELCLSICLLAIAPLSSFCMSLCGRNDHGAGWRAAAAGAVWLPVWALGFAVPIAVGFNALPPLGLDQELLEAVSAVFTIALGCITVVYMGIAGYYEKRQVTDA